jgi:1,4-alpha-glucan branching enzyme
MKKNGKKPKNNGQHTNLVRFELKHPTAAAVAIAGTFNDWSPGATPMIALGNGRWIKELALSSGRYEYLFVADGQWIPDPTAECTTANPFGGVNSLLTVRGQSESKA